MFCRCSIVSSFFFHLLFLFLFAGCSDDPAIIDPRGAGSVNKPTDLPREDGEFIFADGSSYVGELAQEKPDGFGKRKFLNGDIYEGDFRNGRQSGEGTMVYRGNASLRRYEGAWAADKRHGRGALEYSNGAIRWGLWTNDSFERGSLEDESGVVYTGIWQGDVLISGTAQWADGSSFTGIWENGTYKDGTLVNAQGDRYVGLFRSTQYQGLGSLERRNGEVYVGQFEDSLYHGVGRLEFADGITRSGQFKDGMLNGQGKQVDPSGVEYLGSWMNGRRHGGGVLSFADGSRFEGEFQNGLAVDGQYYWADGRVTRSYQDENGEWKDR